MQPSENALVRAHALELRSPHNRLVTLVLCWFFGVFGVHRFYLGKWMTGLMMLLTGGGFGIWWIVDFVVLLLGRFRDAEGRVLGPPQIEYESLPEKREPKRLTARPEPVEPELAPLREPDFELDDEMMRDPLEDKFDELERELGGK